MEGQWRRLVPHLDAFLNIRSLTWVDRKHFQKKLPNFLVFDPFLKVLFEVFVLAIAVHSEFGQVKKGISIHQNFSDDAAKREDIHTFCKQIVVPFVLAVLIVLQEPLWS